MGLFYNIEAALMRGGNFWLGSFYAFEGSFIEATKFSFWDVFFNYEAVNSYNSSLWTMKWEVWGSYLLIIVLLCSRVLTQNNSRRLYLFLGILGIYIWIISAALFSFLLGIMIAYIYVNKRIWIERIQKSIFLRVGFTIATIGAYVGSIVAGNFQFVFLQESLYSIAAFWLIGAIIVNPFMQHFFSIKFSRFLGKISFPLYIVNIFIICTLTSFLIVHYGQDINTSAILIITAITLISMILVSWIFYPVEKFSIKLSSKIAQWILQ
ncbi:hypothetical protein FACS1894182_09640 [Bacteroidia bacterium]|nr:hypothetical protein FACS1894182_09640 [Bacteroidia bacterium]